VISAKTLKTTMDQIDYFLIYHDHIPIGTVITLNTNYVVGIHGMGILPSYRKQGFAKEVLLEFLNRAVEQKRTMATLQASTMGKAIYKSIGFREDFLLRNYRLN
jgi:predicted acetyltransferase